MAIDIQHNYFPVIADFGFGDVMGINLKKLLPFLLIFFLASVGATSSADYSLDGNISGYGISGQAIGSPDYNALIAFGGQAFTGETNSPDYNAQVGWIYTYIFADSQAPLIIAVYPDALINQPISSFTFSALISDNGIGVEYCTAKVYYNNGLQSTQSLSITDAYLGTCQTTIALPNNSDVVHVIFTATDYAGNTSLEVQTADFQRNDSGHPTSIGGTGGGGGIGNYCFSSAQCLRGLICANNNCSMQATDNNFLIIYPSELNGAALPSQPFTLPDLILTNTTNRAMPIKLSFDCRSEAFCAKDWCSIDSPDFFDLAPNYSKKIAFSCNAPPNVQLGSSYYSELTIKADYPSDLNTFLVPIAILIGSPQQKPTVIENLPIFPLATLYNAGNSIKALLDYGVICFGFKKDACLLRLPELPVNFISHVPFSWLILIILLALNIRTKLKNRLLLALLIFWIAITALFSL